LGALRSRLLLVLLLANPPNLLRASAPPKRQSSASSLPADIAPNSWTTGTPMPTTRSGPFIGAVGTKIYVIGGATQSVFNVNEIYDTATNTWSTGAPMPTARWLGATAVVNDVIYTIGGASASSSSNVVEAYDPSTDTWSTKSPMPVGNDSMYATVENNIIYVIGGCCDGSGNRLSTVFAYNPASDSWKTLAPLNIGKSQSALGAFGSQIVSAGGLLTNMSATTDNEEYDVTNNFWTKLDSLPDARQAGCFGTAANVLYFAGGHNKGNGNPLATMDAYDTTSHSWESGLPSMPHAVVNPGSASVNGRLYCFGGSDAGFPTEGNFVNYVQIYQPSLPPCSICAAIANQYANTQAKHESVRLCHILMGALKELGDYRTSFLKNPRFVNIFPTVYYNTTSIEMQRMAAGDFRHPVQKMRQMLAFFDSYKWNRDAYDAGRKPEPQWRGYYTAANAAENRMRSKLPDLFPDTLGLAVLRVITEGVVAHVDYDFPRALRYAFRNHAPDSVDLDDFIKTNETIRLSADASANDIYYAFRGSYPWNTLLEVPTLAHWLNDKLGITQSVIDKRMRAWKLAFQRGNVPLPTSEAQPTTNHELLMQQGMAYCDNSPHVMR
jgi:N-acetylneuraminic acid mutarotase